MDEVGMAGSKSIQTRLGILDTSLHLLFELVQELTNQAGI